MFFRFRPIQSSDFRHECLRCAMDVHVYSEEEKRHLPAFWKEMHESGRMVAACIEDLNQPVGRRLVWLCCKVFPTPEIADPIRAGLMPYYTRQLFHAWMKGQDLPLLTLPEIQKANSAPAPQEQGMTMLIISQGFPDEIVQDDQKLDMVVDKLLAFTDYFSSGYRVKEILEEFYGDYALRLARNAGFQLRSDYAGYYSRLGVPTPPPGRHPYLVGSTIHEARQMPGTLFSSIFRYRRPRFFFRAKEQEVLLRSLIGETDEEVAENLCIAPVTVNKRWQSIYARVDEVAPEIFRGIAESRAAGKRVAQKKRRLLAYLLHHPEELRPLVPHDAAASSGAAAA